jgi:RNA polymerase sigma-70 factor, ECF subfamily
LGEQGLGPPTDDAQPPYDAPLTEALWLEPMPDRWFAEVTADPEARYGLRESVALAFIAALQVLPPPQRATLLLRDVVGLSAAETAAALEQSVSSVNSALHRARAAIDEKVAPRDPASFVGSEADEAVLTRYVRALADSDVEAMLALIHDDMHTTMPPVPTWVAGRAANARFYRQMFARFRVGAVAAIPLGANGQPGFAFYRDGELRAIEVVEVRDGQIWRMHHFMAPVLFPLFTPDRPGPLT